MTEFGGGEPFCLLVRTFITEPTYEVEQLTASPSIDFRIEDLGDLVLEFTIDLDWRRRRLRAVRDGIGNGRLELGDMKDWVHSLHGVREAESTRVGTWLRNDFEGPKVLIGELRRRPSGAEVLGLHECGTTNVERGSR